jgi:hypothetical protein
MQDVSGAVVDATAFVAKQLLLLELERNAEAAQVRGAAPSLGAVRRGDAWRRPHHVHAHHAWPLPHIPSHAPVALCSLRRVLSHRLVFP